MVINPIVRVCIPTSKGLDSLMKVGWPSPITRSWSTLPWMNDLMIAGMMALAAATKDKDDAAACLKVNRPTSVRFFGLSSTLEKWVALYSEMKYSRGTSWVPEVRYPELLSVPLPAFGHLNLVRWKLGRILPKWPNQFGFEKGKS